MADSRKNEYQEDVTVLNELLAVQNVIYVFHSAGKIAEFSSAAIKLVPGISFCSFCLLGHSNPYGDRNEYVDRLAEGFSGITDFEQKRPFTPPENENLHVFNLQSRRFFFGYVFIIVSEPERFEKFHPAVSNLLNIVSINLENQQQNYLLLKNEKFLEDEINLRTAELRIEMEQKLRSQSDLKDSQHRYKELSDSIPIGIFESDLNGNLIYGNKTAYEWFGYTEQEVRDGITIFDCIIKDEQDKVRTNFREVLKTGIRSDNEYTAKRKDGSVFSVIISSFPIFTNGKLSGLRGSMSDVTARKNAERVLLKSELHFRTLFEKSHEGIMYLSTEGRVIHVNDAFTKILGFSVDELKMGKLLQTHLKLSDSGNFDNLLGVLKGDDMNFEISHPHKDGRLVVLEVNASMVDIENEKFIIVLIRDITFRKQAEIALKQKSDDLENLVGISNALISTLVFDNLLQKIVENAVKLHNLDTGALYLAREKDLYLHATAPALPPGTPDNVRIALINDHPHVKKALKTGEPVSVGDSSTENFTRTEQEIVDMRHLVSCIYVPILIQKRSVGILILSTTVKKKFFSEEEISIYKLLSTQLGLVIENANLFWQRKNSIDELEKKNRDLQFLGELSFALADMPADGQLQEFLLKRLMDYTGAVAAASTKFDPVSGYMMPDYITAEKKILPRILRETGKNYSKARKLITKKILQKMLAEVVDVSTDTNTLIGKAAGIKNFCTITLSDSGKLLGSVMLGFKDNTIMPSRDLLVSIGNIASVKLQRDQAEKELRISETRLREIITNISDVISIIDRSGVISFVSQNVEKILGFPVSYFIGKSGLEFVHPEDVPYMKGLLKDLIKKPGVPIYTEMRKICSDGSFKWVRGSAVNLLNDPSIDGILINFEDVDKIKKAEESLLKFRLGIERSPEAVFITDPEGHITYINPAFTKVYGYTQKEVIGSTPRILKSGTYPEKVYSDFWETLLSRKVVEGELINKRKDGKLITIEGFNNPIMDQKGEIIGFLGIHRDISIRKSNEEALRFSEERFRRVFMTNPDSVNVNRLESGLYIDVNDGFTSLTGYTRQDVIGKTSYEINIWADINDRARLVEGIKASGTVTNLEAKFRMKDGALKTGLMSASIIILNGEPHIISITRDIELIRQTQDALKESEDRLKKVVENAEEWIWEVDSSGKYTYSSPVIEKILGFKPDELVGKKYFYDLFFPEQRDKMKKQAFKVFEQKGKFHKFINRNLNKKGETIYLETTGAPILDNDGKLTGYLGADSDVTERILNEEKLRKLSLAVEQSPASIVITDTNGVIEYVNNRFIELTGYSWEELLGNNPRVLKSGKTKDSEYKDLWDRISAGKEWRGEFLNRKKNGEYFWESATISPIFDSQGKITHYLGIKEDITDKKGAAKLMIDKIIEAEERERLRYSNELHDGLGPIISTIKLYFQLLNENNDPVQKKLIIEKADNCIDEAIQSLKEISHNLSPNVVNNFGLVSGIQSFINRLRETQVFQIEFNSDFEGRLERNVEVTLYRIVTEMINNTYKYASASRVSINLSYSETESLINLQYKDNGKGFDVEKTLLKGRGLGISSIYQRVNAMNGRTILISEPGKGVSLNVEMASLLLDK